MLEHILVQIPFKKPENLYAILGMFKEIHFEKNEYLVKENQINDKIFFIKSGIIREYSKLPLDADADAELKRNTHWIVGASEWIFQVKSFIEEKPALCNIQALEKVKVFTLHKSDFKKIMADYPEVMPFVVGIYERYLLQLDERNMLFRIKLADKRLAAFEKKYPQIAGNVKLQILASFINITDCELSRIRKKRAKNHS